MAATAKKKKAKRKATARTASVPSQPKTVLVLRTTDKDGKSYQGYQWPESGDVTAPDWQPTKECGHGFHGWLWGAGDWKLKSECHAPWWYVLEVEESSLIDLGGKVKFPKCKIVSRFRHWREAMAVIRERLKNEAQGVLQSIATNYKEIASATGNSGHASATGSSGHASATGDFGHASATGDFGWSIAGYGGKAKANANGVLTLLWIDEKAKRPRVVVGYVGEDGIKADTWYCVENGKLSEVK